MTIQGELIVCNADSYCGELAALAHTLGLSRIKINIAGEHQGGFQAALQRYYGDHGACFVSGRTTTSVSQIVSPKASQKSGHYLVGGLLEGDLTCEADGALLPKAYAEELFLSEYAAPMTMSWSAHRVFYVVMPKGCVFPSRPRRIAGGIPLIQIPRSALTEIVYAQARCLVGDLGGSSARCVEFALAGIFDAVTILVQDVLADSVDDARRAALSELDTAKQYIIRSCSAPEFNVAVLAEMLGRSRSSLYRLFERFELNVGEEIRTIRMHRAERLLKDNMTSRDLQAVALDCGYSDLSAFGKSFRRKYGVPPSAWRSIKSRTAPNPDVLFFDALSPKRDPQPTD